MAPFEALYGLGGNAVAPAPSVGLRWERESFLVQCRVGGSGFRILIRVIRDRLQSESSEELCRPAPTAFGVEFDVLVYVKVSPWKGKLRFGSKGKHRDFPIRFVAELERWLTDPPHLQAMHDVFAEEEGDSSVSVLPNCGPRVSSWSNGGDKILDRQNRQLRSKQSGAIGKGPLAWQGSGVEDITWDGSWNAYSSRHSSFRFVHTRSKVASRPPTDAFDIPLLCFGRSLGPVHLHLRRKSVSYSITHTHSGSCFYLTSRQTNLLAVSAPIPPLSLSLSNHFFRGRGLPLPSRQ